MMQAQVPLPTTTPWLQVIPPLQTRPGQQYCPGLPQDESGAASLAVPPSSCVQSPCEQAVPALQAAELQHACPAAPHVASQTPCEQLVPALQAVPLQHACPAAPHMTSLGCAAQLAATARRTRAAGGHLRAEIRPIIVSPGYWRTKLML
jgi:hypothetical protein